MRTDPVFGHSRFPIDGVVALRSARSGLWAAVLIALAGCSPDYSPNTYSANAVQQANKVETAVVIGYREVAISANGTVGAVTGGAAGGILGAQAGPTNLQSALGAVGGSAAGSIVGTAIEHVTGDTTGWEYIVRKSNGDLLSVTQREPAPLPIGQRVLVITGNQARIIPDYSQPAEPAAKEAAKEPAPAAQPAPESRPATLPADLRGTEPPPAQPAPKPIVLPPTPAPEPVPAVEPNPAPAAEPDAVPSAAPAAAPENAPSVPEVPTGAPPPPPVLSEPPAPPPEPATTPDPPPAAGEAPAGDTPPGEAAPPPLQQQTRAVDVAPGFWEQFSRDIEERAPAPQ